MATLLQPYLVALDGNGEPMAGAKLAFYVTGTTTPQAVYARSDTTPSNELTNPVVANSDGLFPPIYLGDGSAYKMILRTAEDVAVSTVDPVLVPRANVITEEGSLIIGDAGGQPSELPIGVADRVLYSSGTTASWEQINLATSPVLTGALPRGKGGTGSALAAPVRAVLTAYSTDTGMIIPYDDTIPQSSEGKQIFSQAFAVATAGNRIRITVNGSFAIGADHGCLALFTDSGTDATACHFFAAAGDGTYSQTAIWEFTPSGGTHTYKVRFGSGGGYIAVNGGEGSRRGGGVNQTNMIVEELPTT